MIIEEETKEDFSAVQQACMTMRFNTKPLIDNDDSPKINNQDDGPDEPMMRIQGSCFNNFEGVSYRALDAINQKEADKELTRVNRLIKKMK